ncbi:MAG: LysR family transcriptional regulator [Rhodobacteraceae bacterium]|nr:LysR family transcriptional regulator [Paracoccaceae bacterium]
MDKLQALDWSLLQAFTAVAETGSLSAAARRLGQSQPTLGRQIAKAEAALGTALFTRQPRGLSLNESGAALYPLALEMQTAARRLSLLAAGQSQSLQGTVRITASKVFSHYSLPPILAQIRQAEPEIQLELAPSDSTENLLFREADIAIRMYRPTQEDVIARKLGEIKTGLFAHKTYLAQRGTPQTVSDITAHDMVGLDRNPLIIDAMKALGIPRTREDFPVRCDDQATYWELAKAGCGLGATQLQIGQRSEDMVQILPDLPLENLPVWLVAAKALRQTPRIRRVYDLLAKAIKPLCDA